MLDYLISSDLIRTPDESWDIVHGGKGWAFRSPPIPGLHCVPKQAVISQADHDSIETHQSHTCVVYMVVEYDPNMAMCEKVRKYSGPI